MVRRKQAVDETGKGCAKGLMHWKAEVRVWLRQDLWIRSGQSHFSIWFSPVEDNWERTQKNWIAPPRMAGKLQGQFRVRKSDVGKTTARDSLWYPQPVSRVKWASGSQRTPKCPGTRTTVGEGTRARKGRMHAERKLSKLGIPKVSLGDDKTRESWYELEVRIPWKRFCEGTRGVEARGANDSEMMIEGTTERQVASQEPTFSRDIRNGQEIGRWWQKSKGKVVSQTSVDFKNLQALLS